MLLFIYRRLALLFLTALLISLLIYTVSYDVAPPDSDFAWGYVEYLQRLLHGDLGVSKISGSLVLEDIKHYFPSTVLLCLAALAVALLLGVPLAVLAALNKGKLIDKLIMAFNLIGYAVPVYWLSLLGIMFFSLQLNWLPPSGQINLLYDIPEISGVALFDVLLSDIPAKGPALRDALHHLLMPVLILAMVPISEVIRQVRSSLIDIMKQNYVKAALSRGLSKRHIIWRHGLRNALPAALPLLALQFSSVLTATMIVEIVFEWHGIGRWIIATVALQDFTAFSAATLVISLFVVVVGVGIEIATVLLFPARRQHIDERAF
ncbi:MAG: ABC transporter permease subunit [Aeromonas sp.]